MKKNGYWNILIYTVLILGIMYLQKIELISYTMMEIFLGIALAIFALFNFKEAIMKKLMKK